MAATRTLKGVRKRLQEWVKTREYFFRKAGELWSEMGKTLNIF